MEYLEETMLWCEIRLEKERDVFENRSTHRKVFRDQEASTNHQQLAE